LKQILERLLYLMCLAKINLGGGDTVEFTSIKNKKANINCCHQYLHRPLNMSKSIIEVGKPLSILYEIGSSFGHEMVIGIEYLNKTAMRVETQNKIWIIS